MEILRQAHLEDARAIRALIHQVGINPTELDWRRFWVVVDHQNCLLACGQVKTHLDGTRELASIAVQPEWRGRGLARQVIERLIEQNHPPLYLTCQSSLQPLYQKFGFRVLARSELPPYFRRISALANFAIRVLRLDQRLLVMLWEG